MAAGVRGGFGATPPSGIPAGPVIPAAAAMAETLGPYRLIHQLGEGGMGVVHLGLDRKGRAVAVKVLRPHVAHDPAARLRLEREVDALSRVRDAGVAAVIDADLEGDRPYLVTQYVPGPSLEDVVRDTGPLHGEALLVLGRGLAAALNAIHAAGVVHRDLKPGNVLLLDGRPIVIDFGIAHVTDDIRLTMTGLVMGTPGYLSPEVVEGEPVTEATDWWGWAATLAFAAVGTPPFGRGPMDLVLERVRTGRADLTGVDQRLAPLLYAALSPDPRERPDAADVVAGLERYAAGGAAATMPVRKPARMPVRMVGATESIPRRADAPGQGGNEVEVATPAGSDEPAAHVDPRIGRPMRAGTIAALLVLVVALAAVVPVVAGAVLFLWCLTARTADRSVTSLVLRRHEAGARRSDVPVAVLAAPWHLLSAALATVLGLLLPALVAIASAFSAALVVTTAQHSTSSNPTTSIPLAAAALGGALMAWWGPGGASLRRGSRSLIRGTVRGATTREVVAAACLVVAGGLASWAFLRHGLPLSWPLQRSSLPFVTYFRHS